MWPTYLFVGASIILLQCLQHIPAFGGLDEENTGPNHWKRNKFTWHLLQKWAVWNKTVEYHTPLVQQCFSSILEQSNPSKPGIAQYELRKKSIKFLVPGLNNASWFHSYLRTTSGYHRMDKSCFNSHCQKNFFPNPVLLLQNFQQWLFYFILRILALVIGSCDPA